MSSSQVCGQWAIHRCWAFCDSFTTCPFVVMGTTTTPRWIFTSGKLAWDRFHLCKFIERKKARSGGCLELVCLVRVIALLGWSKSISRGRRGRYRFPHLVEGSESHTLRVQTLGGREPEDTTGTCKSSAFHPTRVKCNQQKYMGGSWVKQRQNVLSPSGSWVSVYSIPTNS